MVKKKVKVEIEKKKEKSHSKPLNIKNPQRTVLMRWIIITLFFSFIGIRSFLNFKINSMDGMVIMVSLVIVPTSLFFIRTTLKNVKVIDGAIERGIMLVHWKYTNSEWLEYLNYEKGFRLGEGSLIAMFLGAFTAIIFIPFAIIVGEWAMIWIMFGLFGLYGFMGFVLPRIIYFIRKRSTGEVILLEKGIILAKQFYTWDFPLSKFNSARFIKKPYEHLEVVYEFIDRTGPRSYVVNIPIPKNNKENIDQIIKKFK